MLDLIANFIFKHLIFDANLGNLNVRANLIQNNWIRIWWVWDKFFDPGWVIFILHGSCHPPKGLENFPLKYQIFQFFSLRVKNTGRLLIYCRSKVCLGQVRSRSISNKSGILKWCYEFFPNELFPIIAHLSASEREASEFEIWFEKYYSTFALHL